MRSRTHELPTFLDETQPVELLARVLAAEVDGATLLLRCATELHEPLVHDYYGTRVETTLVEPAAGPPATVALDFLGNETLRVRYAPGAGIPPASATPMLATVPPPAEIAVEEDARAVRVAWGRLALEVVRDPWQLVLRDADDAVIWATRPVDLEAFRRPEDQWNPPETRWIFYNRFAYPLGVARRRERPQAFVSFALAHDEHVYGFGESFGRVDKRETEQVLWLQEAFSNASPASYKRAPFYMTTRGYGLFLNTSHAVQARVGTLEHTALSLTVDDTEGLDFFVMAGPRLRDILPRYTALTGRPGVPPRWSFGLWMGRISYNRQDQVERVAEELRAHRIPCDVIHIDTDWFARDWECDLRFGPEKFPDPAAMTRRLRALGFRVCLWQWPNLLVDSPMFTEGSAAGHLARGVNGHTLVFPGFERDAGFIDYSSPAAAEWVQAKLRALFELGVAVIKTDFGEGAPPTARYANMPPSAMHNAYPLLYNDAVFTVTREQTGDGVVWSRSAWAGSQRHPVHWSGDGIARYEDLACVLRSSLSFGLSGFPFYSHDIGGFSGLPSPDLYVRWAQLGLLSSHARCHGAPPREPWAFGEEAEAVFRTFDELRYRLLPYLWSEAVACGETSLPLVRALVLEFQDDPTCAFVEDQYMLGSVLLVAPVLEPADRRRVYLPPGEWVDFWTDELLAGGRWADVAAPLERVPLFVRAGAVLPLGPPAQHTGEATLEPLRFELWAPGDAGSAVVRGDDGAPAVRVAYARDGEELRVEVTGAPGEVSVAVRGAEARGGDVVIRGAGTARLRVR